MTAAIEIFLQNGSSKFSKRHNSAKNSRKILKNFLRFLQLSKIYLKKRDTFNCIWRKTKK